MFAGSAVRTRKGGGGLHAILQWSACCEVKPRCDRVGRTGCEWCGWVGHLAGKAHVANAAMCVDAACPATSQSLQELHTAVAAMTRSSMYLRDQTGMCNTHTTSLPPQPAWYYANGHITGSTNAWSSLQCATVGALPLLSPHCHSTAPCIRCQDYTTYIQQQQQQRLQPESCMPSTLTTPQAARSSQPCSCFASPAASTEPPASSIATPACPVHGRLHIQPPLAPYLTLLKA